MKNQAYVHCTPLAIKHQKYSKEFEGFGLYLSFLQLHKSPFAQHQTAFDYEHILYLVTA